MKVTDSHYFIDMPQNIDDFNSGVALILGKLYENFPNGIRLSTNELTTITYAGDSPLSVEAIERHNELYGIYFHTARFLLAEGYIRGTRVDGYTFIDECTLTTKGLAALQKTPDSIKDKKLSVGDFLIELGKDGLKSVAKESVTLAIRAILNG